MNPRPIYAPGKSLDLPAGTEFGSLARFKLGSYEGPLEEPVVAAPSNPQSRLRSLALRRIFSAIGAKKHPPSFATPSNELVLTLASRIEKGVRTILQDGGSQSIVRNRLREIEPNIPPIEYRRFLKLLREARDHPISATSRSRWNHLLTEVVLILDPVERFPALDRVRSAKGPESVKGEKARLRSGLLNLFNKSLKNLLGS